ncbi:MAG: peptidase [Cyanobacteriota bacterium]|nr:peptidase [Cyanobacteriota bacterium]
MPPAEAPGYATALRPTPWGWLHQRHWCIWVDPASGEGAARGRADQWHRAVLAALATWGEELHLEMVTAPEAAHVLVRRQRPPLRLQSQAVQRASHGRAEWQVQVVDRPSGSFLEPTITVQVGADQRPAAMAATLLHELGHAFGLWGHSPHPNDVMAATPGATPVQHLSERDRLTLRWLLEQPSAVGPRSP